MKRPRPDTPEGKARIDRRKFLAAAAVGGAAVGGVVPLGSPALGAAGGVRTTPQTGSIPAAGAWIELDRRALIANLAAIRARAGGRPVMAVVKANAYGHGVVPMAQMLVAAGVDALMVITVDEALAIRSAGIDAPLLNYGPYDESAAAELVARRVDQAVYTLEGVAGMAAAGGAVGTPANVQLILDTGLGRVGVPVGFAAGADDSPPAGASAPIAAAANASPPRAKSAVAQASTPVGPAADIFAALAEAAGSGALRVTGTATALSEDPDFDRVQLARYRGACDAARRQNVEIGKQHVASSAAVLDFADAHLDMVRPGIMLYGHYPNEASMRERPIELIPVLSLRAKVAFVKTLRAGESIGYHRAWVAERETVVATLPVGHYEGYPAPALAAGAAVEIHGRACALVGGITSNHMEVAIPEGLEVSIGDVATLIAGGDPRGAGLPGLDAPDWLPTAPQLGEWGGSGIYGTLMHLDPTLPHVIIER